MKKNIPNQSQQISKSRKRIFRLISMLLPFIFLILLEVILRISGFGDNLSLFIDHPDKDFKAYKIVNPKIGKKYFSNMDYSYPGKDIFRKEKQKDVFRIFVMGSSTVVGFPYDNNLMFSRILSERLRDAYPDKKVEMINTAITAINSFTLVDFMPQILAEKPDAILIYAGHNEFYGAFGAGSNEAAFRSPALIRIHLKLMNYRIYELLKKIVNQISGVFKSDATGNENRGTLMSKIVKNADITFGSELYKEGITNYEQNLNAMLALAEQHQVKVFISDLFSNIHDLKPFKSLEADGLKPAVEYFEAAKNYEQQNEIYKARENYVLARDYDCIRFRASTDINQLIKKLAEKHKANFISTLNLFEADSPNGIIGNNLLVEHVHPNITGEFLLAEAFYNGIIQSKVIAEKINPHTVKTLKNFRKSYGYSALDSLIGHHRITNLKYHWPFRDDAKDYVDYRLIYKPSGEIDSLAFNVMAKQQMSLTAAHEFLAEKYLKMEDYPHAYQEYNCLTKLNPFWGYYDRKTADCLLKMNDLPEALRYFERSFDYGDENFYAHFRAGEICMIKFDFERAIMHFQKAQLNADKPEKEKALIKIYQCLTYLNRANEGIEIATYFKNQNPKQSIPIPSKTYTYLNYVPNQVKRQVDEALKQTATKDYDKAIELLTESLAIYETPIVFRLLGEAFNKNKQYDHALLNLKKALPEFKFDTGFLRIYFMTALEIHNKNEAQTAVEQLKRIEPNNPEVGILSGLIKNLDSFKNLQQ